MGKPPRADDAVLSLQAYRDMIPADVRAEVLDTLLKARMSGFQDFVDTTTYVMAHVLAGNIPTNVADSMRGYLELLFTAVSANALATKGVPGGLTADHVRGAAAASKGRLTANVILDDTPDGLKVDLAVVPTLRQEPRR